MTQAQVLSQFFILFSRVLKRRTRVSVGAGTQMPLNGKPTLAFPESRHADTTMTAEGFSFNWPAHLETNSLN